jgi:hypothetical protein
VWRVETARLNLAKFLIRTGDAASALPIAEAVLEAQGRREGLESAYLITALDVVVAAANLLGDWTRVATYAHRLASIIALTRGPRNEEVGKWLARQHAALVASGNVARALEVEHALAALDSEPPTSYWEERVRLGRQLAAGQRQPGFAEWLRLPPAFRRLEQWPWEATWRHPDGTTARVTVEGPPTTRLFGLGAEESEAALLRSRAPCHDPAIRLVRVGSPAGELDVARCTEPAGDEDRITEVTALRRGDVRVYLTVTGRTSTRATVEGAGRAARAGLTAAKTTRP